MSSEQAMRLMRQIRQLLVQRGMCALWLPGEPTLCCRTFGHPAPCRGAS